MEFSFYYAEVIWCWWEGNVRKTAQEAIVLSAQSYAEAAGMIEENYGEELHCIDRLECIGEGLMLPLSLVAGRDLRKAALDYGAAEIVEEKDFSKKADEAIHIGPMTHCQKMQNLELQSFSIMIMSMTTKFPSRFIGILIQHRSPLIPRKEQ